jgi:amino acid transporter
MANDGTNAAAAEPSPTLTLVDAIAIVVGIVVGIGVFKTPSVVAANAGSNLGFLLAWPLCWLGRWEVPSRCAEPYATPNLPLPIAFGDYAAQVFPLGDYGSSLYATEAIALLTALNVIGIEPRKWTQRTLTAVKVVGLLAVCVVGLSLAPAPASTAVVDGNRQAAYGSAMIFVLLTYGGWSEAAYIAAELHDVKHNMVRALVWSISAIAVVFFLVNLAYLKGLGLTAIARSDAIAADLMRRATGEAGAQWVSALVAISVLGSTHGTILTGARTPYALGRDFSPFSCLGHWHRERQTPVNALLLQAAIVLVLVLFGSLTRTGFETMVAYTAPVFWFFLLLTGLSLFVLRTHDPDRPRPFCVPFYPLTPLLYCGTSVYLLQSSLTYTGIVAWVGVAVTIAGIPLLLWARCWEKTEENEIG